MKKISIVLVVCLISFIFIASDCGGGLRCTNVDCGTHGTCSEVDDACECVTGYQINSVGKCDSVSREKFLHTYTVHDECNSGIIDYTASIIEDSTSIILIVLNNFGNYHTSNEQLKVSAQVILNTLEIPTQTLLFNNETYQIHATNAAITKAGFTLHYKVDKNGVLDLDCTAVYTKQ